MNVGYTRSSWVNTDIDSKDCPVCGKNIYIYKRGNNYACEDIKCPLGHGAKELIYEISKILNMME